MRKPGGAGDINAGRSFVSINSIERNGEVFPARWNHGVHRIDCHIEIGHGRANRQAINISLPARAAGVGDANKIGAIGGRGERSRESDPSLRSASSSFT